MREVTLTVSDAVADALQNDVKREAAGRLLERVVLNRGMTSPLFAALDACGQEAEAAGLTEEDVQAELAAHKRERRR